MSNHEAPIVISYILEAVQLRLWFSWCFAVLVYACCFLGLAWSLDLVPTLRFLGQVMSLLCVAFLNL